MHAGVIKVLLLLLFFTLYVCLILLTLATKIIMKNTAFVWEFLDW